MELQEIRIASFVGSDAAAVVRSRQAAWRLRC